MKRPLLLAVLAALCLGLPPAAPAGAGERSIQDDSRAKGQKPVVKPGGGDAGIQDDSRAHCRQRAKPTGGGKAIQDDSRGHLKLCDSTRPTDRH